MRLAMSSIDAGIYDGVSVAKFARSKGKRQTCPTTVDSGALMTQVEIRVNPEFAFAAKALTTTLLKAGRALTDRRKVAGG
ncbi:hypothetical protein FG93_03840 [Bosea sp. LC85]|nr:hypothetical protein FG93_03840 [Bosea sp. LC85]